LLSTFDKAEADGLGLGWRTIALKKAFFDSQGPYSIRDGALLP
jgi:hypothetical protein